jgi:biotin carboxyl carrier protein
MADVTADATAARVRGSNGSEPGDGESTEGKAVRSAADRSRAVRVRLGPASRSLDDPTLVVAPALAPVAAAEDPDARGVLAQRHATVDGEQGLASLVALDATRHRLLIDGVKTDVVLEPARQVARGVLVREVLVGGFRFEVEVEPDRLASLRERATRDRGAAAATGPLEVRAVIPGRVVRVAVAPGDEVTTGSQLLVVEAMKMQNELRSPRDGTIARVGVSVGQAVEIGDVLVMID